MIKQKSIGGIEMTTPEENPKSSGKKWVWIIVGILFLVIFVLPAINALSTGVGQTGVALFEIFNGVQP